MNKSSKIYIAGHRGLVGSAIHRKLLAEGYTNLIYRTSSELNLENQTAVKDFFKAEKPEYIFMCSAKVGGVLALNTYKADVNYSNTIMQANVIESAYRYGVEKMMFMASNCIYPMYSARPIKEEYLLAGKLESNTEAYAIAKINGIKMCQAYREQYGCNFITVVPVNMYGMNDNHNLETAHVMPALVTKFHNAKKNNLPTVEIWGTGGARREFMHSDDLADACLFLMHNYNESEPINVGTGEDISILELAELIKEIAGYEGKLTFDLTKPNGAISKVLDVSKLHGMGWKHKTELREGITKLYNSL